MANTKTNKRLHLDLFHEIKNLNFVAFQNLSNLFLDRHSLTEQEIKELFIQQTATTDTNYINTSLNEFIAWLLADANDTQTISLLGPDDSIHNAYVPTIMSDDYPAVPIPTPYLLTIFEKRYLKTLLLDNAFTNLLTCATRNKLEKLLENISPFEWESTIDYRGQELDNDLQHCDILASLKIILKALQSHKCLYCTNHTPNRVFEDQLIYPYRLMYSPVHRQLQLIATNADAQRIILLTLSKLSNIRIGTQDNLDEDIFKSLIRKRKQAKTPIVLEIEDKNNAIERTFIQFSNLQKSSYFDDKRNIYVMHLYYYDFDEDDIITKILFLGDAITVIEPSHIRQKIRATINKALRLYE